MTFEVIEDDLDDDAPEVVALKSAHRSISAENTFLRHTLLQLRGEVDRLIADIQEAHKTVEAVQRKGRADRAAMARRVPA